MLLYYYVKFLQEKHLLIWYYFKVKSYYMAQHNHRIQEMDRIQVRTHRIQERRHKIQRGEDRAFLF